MKEKYSMNEEKIANNSNNNLNNNVIEMAKNLGRDRILSERRLPEERKLGVSNTNNQYLRNNENFKIQNRLDNFRKTNN